MLTQEGDRGEMDGSGNWLEPGRSAWTSYSADNEWVVWVMEVVGAERGSVRHGVRLLLQIHQFLMIGPVVVDNGQ